MKRAEKRTERHMHRQTYMIANLSIARNLLRATCCAGVNPALRSLLSAPHWVSSSTLPGGPKNCTMKYVRDIWVNNEINNVKHIKVYRFIQKQCSMCPPCCWTTRHIPAGDATHWWRGQWSTTTVCSITPWWLHAWAAWLQWIVSGVVVISCR